MSGIQSTVEADDNKWGTEDVVLSEDSVRECFTDQSGTSLSSSGSYSNHRSRSTDIAMEDRKEKTRGT